MAGVNPHHPASQVSVFGARHAGYHLHRLHVVNADAARVHSCQGPEAGIASKAHAVHLHGRAESRIARRAASLAQGEAGGRRQVWIYGLASRKQGGYVGKGGHLQMVERISPQGGGSVEARLCPFCRHRHLFYGKGTDFQGEIQLDVPVLEFYFHALGNIAQALHRQQVVPFRNISEDVGPFGIAHSPDGAVVDFQGSSRNWGFAAFLQYGAGDVESCG